MVLVVLTVVSLFLSAFVVFIPFFTSVGKERLSTMQLFLAIPRATIASIHRRLTRKSPASAKGHEAALAAAVSPDMGSGGLEGEVGFEELNIQGGVPTVKKYSVWYVVCIVIISLCLGGVLYASIVYLSMLKTIAVEIDSAAQRRYLHSRLVFSSASILSSSFWEQSAVAARIRDDIDTFNTVHFALKFGNATMGLSGANDDHLQDTISLLPRCLADSGDAFCFSLDTLVTRFLDLTQRIEHSPRVEVRRRPASGVVAWDGE